MTTSSDQLPKTRAEEIKDDILFDICMYEKELTGYNLAEEDKDRLIDAIKSAEDLFKTIK